MIQLSKVFGVLLVAVLGLWGCSRGPSSSPTDAGRLKSLEDKNARLEEDYRSASASRDQLRKRLGTTEQTVAQLQQEVEKLRIAAKERDELQVTLRSRTQERDQVQGQYESFRKNLRDLLGQAEASLERANEVAGAPQGPVLTPAPASAGLPAVAGGMVGPMLLGGGY